MSLRRQALTGVTWTSLATIGSVGAQMLQLVVLARLLRPDDFGLMGMALIVIGFAQAYADVGISAAIVHHQHVSREQLSSLYWLNLAVGASIFAVLWLGSPLIASFFHEPRLVPLLHGVSAVFLLLPLGKQFEILLQRDLRFDLLARQDIAAAVAGAAAAVAGAVAGLGVWALVLGTVTTVATRTALLLWVGLREHCPMLHFRWADLDRFVGFGAYQMGERTVNYVAERLDQLLIGSLLGATTLGFYNFAFNLTGQPVSRINPIVTKVAFPIFCRVQDDASRLQRGYLTIVKLVTSVNAPLLLGLVAVAPLLVPTVFGVQWTASVALVQVLALVALLRSVGNPTGSLLLSRGRADLGFAWNVCLLLVSAPAIWLGAHAGGALGVAFALLGVQIVIAPVSYVALVRPMMGACARAYLLAVMRPTALALLMATIVAAMAGVIRLSVPAMLLVGQVVAGGAAYALLLWRFERATLDDLRAAVLGRA